MATDLLSSRRMTEGKRQALEVAEEAREADWHHPSFVSQLFLGRCDFPLIVPYPTQSPEDAKIGEALLATWERFLRERLDPDAVDRTGELPPDVIRGLAELGGFGMKIKREYGGLGLSQVNYNRTIALVASYCGSTAVWLSAHQSIGVPQPLSLFGTDEQKARFMPRLARGAVSAFALTEPDVGSDPAKMATTATPVDGGTAYLVNGEKLWCTNGPKAELFVVMAKTPPKIVQGREKPQITAFIVERSMPGVEVVHRCQFMGLRAIQNGLLRFRNVRVPAENILWGPGMGLKLALITLNTGRLTLPAACAGVAKQCLGISRRWALERVQWGAPIGHHEAITAKLADMASHTFAMDAVAFLTSALADRGEVDIRLEAAMAKLFCSEQVWRLVDTMVQIRGGRGYETADSLRARGEEGVPAERLLRDARINLIIEGTSEILRLFIAREALDPHVGRVLPLLSSRTSWPKKLLGGMGAAWFYTRWYPRLWLGLETSSLHAGAPVLDAHAAFVQTTSRILARRLFHAMVRYQQGLERRQALLFRFVDTGTELFAMAATLAKAKALLAADTNAPGVVRLADGFCRAAGARIERALAVDPRGDKAAYRLGRDVVDGRFEWLEAGIVGGPFPGPAPQQPAPSGS